MTSDAGIKEAATPIERRNTLSHNGFKIPLRKHGAPLSSVSKAETHVKHKEVFMS